jgi:replicative DNA helicase
MSSVGFGLFKTLIDSGISFSVLTDHQMGEEHFIAEEVLAYNFIRQFILEYGTYPHIDTIARHLRLPSVFSGLVEEPLEFWIEEVKERKRYTDMHSCMVGMRNHLENQSLPEALDLMGNSYLALRESYISRRMANLREVQVEVLEKHDEIQASPELPGLSFGFPFIDNVSGGAQKGDYIIIVGQTGVGKTFLVLKCGWSTHITGKNVICLSTEMSNIQTARRVLALEGRFSTTDLKMGRLSYYGRERANRIVQQGLALTSEGGNYFHLLPGGMFPKVEDFAVVVRELKPDLAIIDGAYLLQGTSKSWWEKNMEVATVLKNLALNEDIPVIATYQYLKKDVGKIEGVGGGFAIPQIASVVLSFEYERKEDIGSFNDVQYRVLRLTKGRDGESGSIRVMYNMRTTQLLQDRRLTGRIEEDEVVEQDLTRDMDDQDYGEI